MGRTGAAAARLENCVFSTTLLCAKRETRKQMQWEAQKIGLLFLRRQISTLNLAEKIGFGWAVLQDR